MRDKYGVLHDADCYPGTDVLVNKLDIRDPRLLEEAEADFAALAAESIELGVPPFDLRYLCRLHALLFGDLYAWAGRLRTVDIAKGQTRFCTASRIAPEADRLLRRLDTAPLPALDADAQIALIAEMYGELNMIHPFREGNGRAQRLLFEHWLLHAGLQVSWAQTDRERWVQACIAAVPGDYGPLEAVFRACISAMPS